ncbi:MAG: type II toxin-antitoxin system HigB family toxin [Candidatus Methylacidiphilales bacterium]|nr:type II toxin-antitoxin system HigB family toxin [Candidatus Methylacidiphilales bacterium]
MHVIAKSTLREFWQKHADVEEALQAWHTEANAAKWTCFQDIKREFGSADCLPGNRVVFNIKGNSYRLIVVVHYNAAKVYIRFVGTQGAIDSGADGQLSKRTS